MVEYKITTSGWSIKLKDKKMTSVKEAIQKAIEKKLPYNLNGRWTMYKITEGDFGNEEKTYIKWFNVSTFNDKVKIL